MSLRRFLTACFLLLLTVAAADASRKWEEVSRMPGVNIEQRNDIEISDNFSVTIVDNFVYVSVSRTTSVKIFTILGQPIVQETLQPGIYRYRLASRGIYLLKAGSSTRRLTI